MQYGYEMHTNEGNRTRAFFTLYNTSTSDRALLMKNSKANELYTNSSLTAAVFVRPSGFSEVHVPVSNAAVATLHQGTSTKQQSGNTRM